MSYLKNWRHLLYVYPPIDDKLHYNFVKVAAVNFDNAMIQFIISKRTDA